MKKLTIPVILANLDVLIAGMALIALVAITFAGVIMRYIFSQPFIWLEEMQIALFLWVAFLGSSAAFRKKGHVEINMIFERFSNRTQKILLVILYVVVSFCLFYLSAKSADMVSMFIRTKKITSVLSIPSALIYGVIPVSSLLMWVNYTFVAFREWRERAGKLKERHS